DANHPVDRLDEDLPVAHLAGARGGEDRLDRRLDERLRADHLDLHLLMEFHDDRGAAVLLHNFLLAPVAADASQRDPGDAGPEQRRFDLRQPLGAHDGSDEFHAGILATDGTASYSPLSAADTHPTPSATRR